MAQVGWVYLDDFGGRNRIGVYHGDRTGHLLIHCNNRIVQVDFSVKESRTYSFFVEDELCEISIVKEKQGFSYDFQVNKKIDTPRNRLRRADERRNRKHIALVIAGLVLVTTLVVLGFQRFGRLQRQKQMAAASLTARLQPEYEQRLAENGRVAVAQLIIAEDALHRRVFYSFLTATDKQVSGQFMVPDTGQVILPNGFPLTSSDAFEVRYLPAEPDVHQVEFFRPAEQTVAGYAQQALAAEQRAHPDASPGHSSCVVERTMEEKGWERLADLIFQATPPEKNLRNNRDSYLRLIRDTGFAKVLARDCWDK